MAKTADLDPTGDSATYDQFTKVGGGVEVLSDSSDATYYTEGTNNEKQGVTFTKSIGMASVATIKAYIRASESAADCTFVPFARFGGADGADVNAIALTGAAAWYTSDALPKPGGGTGDWKPADLLTVESCLRFTTTGGPTANVYEWHLRVDYVPLGGGLIALML